MIDVSIKRGKKIISGQLPESFLELDEKRFLVAVDLLTGTIKPVEAIARLLGDKFVDEKLIFEWMKLEFMEHLAFISEMTDKCNRFIIPSLEIRNGLCRYKLYAPKENLEGVTFLQFMGIDNFFAFYTKTKDMKHLSNMVASIYLRDKDDFITKDKKKNVVEIDKMSSLIEKHVGLNYIFAIYVNWILVKNWLTSQFKYLFAKSSSGESNRQMTDWLEVFDNFVGDHIADMDAYKAMECMDAFRILNNKIHESKRNRK